MVLCERRDAPRSWNCLTLIDSGMTFAGKVMDFASSDVWEVDPDA